MADESTEASQDSPTPSPCRELAVREKPKKKPDPPWMEPFLRNLVTMGGYCPAAHAAGTSPGTVLRWREKHKRFARRWAAAEEEHKQFFEYEVASRAMDRKDLASATLLMFYNKGRRPEVWREFYKNPEDREMLPVLAVLALILEFVEEDRVNALQQRLRVMIEEHNRGKGPK